jgi:hypothetical protein
MFNILILYLKLFTLILLFISVISLFTLSFDPWRYIESLLARRWYRKGSLPKEALPSFQFALFMYGLTSVSLAIMQFYLVVYALAEGMKWSYHALLFSYLSWIIGGFIFHIAKKNYFYVKFVLIPIFILFFVPIILLAKFFL